NRLHVRTEPLPRRGDLFCDRGTRGGDGAIRLRGRFANETAVLALGLAQQFLDVALSLALRLIEGGGMLSSQPLGLRLQGRRLGDGTVRALLTRREDLERRVEPQPLQDDPEPTEQGDLDEQHGNEFVRNLHRARLGTSLAYGGRRPSTSPRRPQRAASANR